MNILNNEKNKELLWNMLYKNKVFNNIPDNNIDEVKNIFENTITFTINNINIPNQNLNKQQLLECNKIILSKINNEINLFKNRNQNVKQLPDFSNINNQATKDDFKNEKVLIFDRNLEDRKKNTDNMLNIPKPQEIDFSDKTDNPINEEKMNNLLERMQKERNIIIDTKENLDGSNKIIKNNKIIENNIISDINKDMDKDKVNINVNDDINNNNDINDINVNDDNNDNDMSKYNSKDDNKNINKIKISNIDDLLNNNSSSLDNFEEDYFIKRSSRVSKDDIEKVISNEYKNEFNNNILNKIDNLSNKINQILETQNIILERLNSNKD